MERDIQAVPKAKPRFQYCANSNDVQQLRAISTSCEIHKRAVVNRNTGKWKDTLEPFKGDFKVFKVINLQRHCVTNFQQTSYDSRQLKVHFPQE
jgi:hypothetical protein